MNQVNLLVRDVARVLINLAPVIGRVRPVLQARFRVTTGLPRDLFAYLVAPMQTLCQDLHYAHVMLGFNQMENHVRNAPLEATKLLMVIGHAPFALLIHIRRHLVQ